MIRKRIYQQGNSCVVSIPRYMLEELGARLGDYLEIDVIGQGVIRGIIRKKEWVDNRMAELWKAPREEESE